MENLVSLKPLKVSFSIFQKKFSDSEKILIPKIILPTNDKTINVVFCNFFIFVFSLNGKVYKSEFNKVAFVVVEKMKKRTNNLNFKLF